jgi:hypothetical protein
VLRSVRELAARLGKSHTAVAGWVRRTDWRFGKGPWEAAVVPEMQEWASRTLSPDPASAPGRPAGPRATKISDLGPRQQADISVKLIKAQREQFKLEQERGLFHKVSECNERLIRQAHSMKTEAMQIPESLPVTPEVKQMIRGRLIELFTRWSQRREP